MNRGYIKRICIIVCLTMLLVGCLAGCGRKKDSPDSEWPVGGLGDMYASASTVEASTIEASVDVPEPTTENVAESESTTENVDVPETETMASDGMRPEFKEAMDSYETFMNQYCDFMKKYAENPSDLGLLTEYADYMAQYAETMEKINAIEQKELSDEELKYYLEVTARVTQKLAEAAQ